MSYWNTEGTIKILKTKVHNFMVMKFGGEDWIALSKLTAYEMSREPNYSIKTVDYARKELAARGLFFADEKRIEPMSEIQEGPIDKKIREMLYYKLQQQTDHSYLENNTNLIVAWALLKSAEIIADTIAKKNNN